MKQEIPGTLMFDGDQAQKGLALPTAILEKAPPRPSPKTGENGEGEDGAVYARLAAAPLILLRIQPIRQGRAFLA
jgi:hypothetical protein